MKRTRKYIAAAAFNCALFIMNYALMIGCTSDDQTLVTADRQPITFTALGIASPTTRSTGDGDWDGQSGKSVSVMIGSETKQYTITPLSGDNTKATLSSDSDPFYWNTLTEMKTVTAWYPSSVSTDGKTFTPIISADQSSDANYQASDCIVAKDKTVKYSATNLEFTHQVAKVAVTLKQGEGCENMDLSRPTIYIYDGTQYVKSHDGNVLIAPTTLPANTFFIRVVIGGHSYYYTLTSEKKIEAGYVYSYTITVNMTGLVLSSCTIEAWGTSTIAAGTLKPEYDEETLLQQYKDKGYTLYTLDNNPFTDGVIPDKAIVTGTNTVDLSIAAGAHVVLYNTTIKNISESEPRAPGIQCNGNATIYLVGKNTVTSQSEWRSGIQPGGEGTTLTIEGNGTLTVTGSDYCPGIGSSDRGTCGDIVINSGTITANGGKWGGAGIGSCANGHCGNITFNGGIVTANGGSKAAGIGTGNTGTCKDITFNSGCIVTAKKGEDNAIDDIGRGRNCNNNSYGTITYNIGATVNGTTYTEVKKVD